MRLQILNDKSGPIALWAFWVLCVLGAVAFWLMVATQAGAQNVGPACTASWTAPTTGTDGQPLQSALTAYRVYVDKGTITPGVTVPTATILPPAVSWACGALTAGTHTLAVSAVNAGGEGPATIPLPFVLVLVPPASPLNPKVQ